MGNCFLILVVVSVLILEMPGGRPNIMQLIKSTYVEWDAEVVFVTSNLQGNQEMMEGCMEAGIPVFVRSFFSLFLFQG